MVFVALLCLLDGRLRSHRLLLLLLLLVSLLPGPQARLSSLQSLPGCCDRLLSGLDSSLAALLASLAMSLTPSPLNSFLQPLLRSLHKLLGCLDRRLRDGDLLLVGAHLLLLRGTLSLQYRQRNLVVLMHDRAGCHRALLLSGLLCLLGLGL